MPNLYDTPEMTTLAALGIKGSTSAIVAMCEQNSSEWFGLRLGIVTASKIQKCIVTSKGAAVTGKMRRTYRNSRVGERLTRCPTEERQTVEMERGINLEPQARDWYAFTVDQQVRQVGFVYGDAKKQWGCSPDGLCADRAIEIKCLGRNNHIDALLEDAVPTEHIGQCQFTLWITGMERLDYVLYTPEPEIPNRIWPVESDAKLHAAFAEYVPIFCAEIDAAVTKIRENMGRRVPVNSGGPLLPSPRAVPLLDVFVGNHGEGKETK